MTAAANSIRFPFRHSRFMSFALPSFPQESMLFFVAGQRFSMDGPPDIDSTLFKRCTARSVKMRTTFPVAIGFEPCYSDNDY
jgi:hypothetical protein